jgi:putative hydrolase of the HAD superfamily
VKALICDLDNTLFSPRTIPREVLQPVLDALFAANTGTSRVEPEALARALEEGWRRPFNEVVREHALPPWVLETWARANRILEVPSALPLFDDVACLWDLPLRRFLVTTGFRRFQESKVRALGLAERFEAVLVDDVDDAVRLGKEGIFRRILQHADLVADQVVVLGDSAESEIAAGSRLGMITVQIVREGIVAAERADFRIRSCAELPEILQAMEAGAAGS